MRTSRFPFLSKNELLSMLSRILLISTSQGSIFSSLGGLTFTVSNSGSCVIGSEFWQISSSVAFEALGSDSTDLKAIRWRSDSFTSSAPDSFNSRECTRTPYLILLRKTKFKTHFMWLIFWTRVLLYEAYFVNSFWKEWLILSVFFLFSFEITK